MHTNGGKCKSISLLYAKSISTHLDPALEAFAERRLEHVLDVHQVHLAARHQDANQLRVVRADAGHALLQAFRKEAVLVVHRPDNGQQTVLDVPGKLLLDRPLQRVARHLRVLVAHQLQLLIVALAQHHVESALVRSDLQLTSAQQLRSIPLSGHDIGDATLVAGAHTQGDQETLKVARRL